MRPEKCSRLRQPAANDAMQHKKCRPEQSRSGEQTENSNLPLYLGACYKLVSKFGAKSTGFFNANHRG